MRVALEKLEEFLTDDRDELDIPGWLSSASAEAHAACYVAARQGGIEVADLLQIAIRCDHLVPFLIQRVLTSEDVPAAQEFVDRHSYCSVMLSTERAALFMLESWIARQLLAIKK
jgi:hypothetical protein